MHMKNKDFGILCEVLKNLHHLSQREWRQKRDLTKETIDNYEDLTATRKCLPMSTWDLEGLLKQGSSKSALSFDKPFYLPPLDEDKDFIPILSLSCDFNKNPSEIYLRIGMYRYPKEDASKLQGFGFRFERHGMQQNSKSSHNYYHMQVTTKPHDYIPHETPAWIPESIPCVLMPAENPVSLVFCMLICFYGKKIVRQMISSMNIDKKYTEFWRYLP